ncbi:MAG: tRNA (adenosine(37)-N6)-threonylcarbamoyltransferase complex dimerization subunit type 1 TsaB [Bacteroidia bacterium]|nr:tRNA (adenosine(37)-N6)-threonylcarbamoyltransferase complex dimerization subunit type 1 TsaB [Bacteroidia bacterium]
MPLILNIETSTQVCSVAVSQGGAVIALEEINERNVHAEMITRFIQGALNKAKYKLNDLDAIAVGSGPGSYTGLRIGTTAAKGLCYALGKPLIAISTLKAMATAAALIAAKRKADLFCPMIDARRQEVYTALYDSAGKEIISPEARILDASSFSGYLKDNTIAFFGDGMPKMKEILKQGRQTEGGNGAEPRMLWLDTITASAANMVGLAEEACLKNDFKDVAYYVPFYLKDFVAKK